MNPERRGSKAAAVYRLMVPQGGSVRVRLRLTLTAENVPGLPGPPGLSPFAA